VLATSDYMGRCVVYYADGVAGAWFIFTPGYDRSLQKYCAILGILRNPRLYSTFRIIPIPSKWAHQSMSRVQITVLSQNTHSPAMSTP